MRQTKKKNTEATICIEHISKRYGSTLAVDDISFNTHCGEIIALLGPNGAGKSTLMNMISGFLSPSEGVITVNGKDVAKETISIKKDIGFLPEGAPMYADMSVKLFLKYMIELKYNLEETETQSKQQIRDIYQKEFSNIVKLAKIEDVLEQRIDTLSKGYLRRVGFAQSIIGNPPILLLDEPTDGLDPNQKDHIRRLIKNMGKDKTIVISTHLLDEAETLASRIILINRGKIVADGSLAEILKKAKVSSIDAAFRTLTLSGEKIDE